jgi:hypothetical protein
MTAVDGSLARVQRLSLLFSRACLVLLILVVGLDILLWLDGEALHRGAAALLPPETPYEMSSGTIAAGFVLFHLVVGLFLYALWQANKLFARFAQGEILVKETGRRLFRIGAAFSLVLPAQIIASGFTSLLLSWGNRADAKVFAMTADPAHAMLSMAGLLILTIGWVMAEAARIADDHAQII